MIKNIMMKYLYELIKSYFWHLSVLEIYKHPSYIFYFNWSVSQQKHQSNTIWMVLTLSWSHFVFYIFTCNCFVLHDQIIKILRMLDYFTKDIFNLKTIFLFWNLFYIKKKKKMICLLWLVSFYYITIIWIIMFTGYMYMNGDIGKISTGVHYNPPEPLTVSTATNTSYK